MSELDDLIAEQARDMQFGDRNQKQGVSLDLLEPFLSEDGLVPEPREHRRSPECAIHGRADIRPHNGRTGWRCGICFRDRSRQYAAAHRDRCNANTRRWRANHADHRREYEREYKRRRYQEDPEYRARELARNRARKQRMREAA